MALMELAAQRRQEKGSGAAHRLRSAGALPGIVYGMGEENLMISVERRDFDRLLRQAAGGAVIVDLKVAGAREKSVKVLIKQVQHDPVTSVPLHLDFQRISMTEPVLITVPIHITGLAEGVKTQGGFMDHILREVEIRCLPDRIPGHLELDVTPLSVGQSLHVSDIKVEEIEIMTPATRVVVAVQGKAAGPSEEAAAEAPKAEGAEAPAGAGEKAEKGEKKES